MKNWYAVPTRTRSEITAAKNILQKINNTDKSKYFSSIFVPTQSNMILTPGVVYVEMEYDNSLRNIIRTVKMLLTFCP